MRGKGEQATLKDRIKRQETNFLPKAEGGKTDQSQATAPNLFAFSIGKEAICNGRYQVPVFFTRSYY